MREILETLALFELATHRFAPSNAMAPEPDWPVLTW